MDGRGVGCILAVVGVSMRPVLAVDEFALPHAANNTARSIGADIEHIFEK
jgi:hypothetical protein